MGISYLAGQSRVSPFSVDSTAIYQKRQHLILYGGVGIYTSLSTGLYFTWYKQYDQGPFHLFNDYGEWENIDKLGHVYSNYLQSDFMYQSLRWSGYSENKSILYGALSGLAFQTTIEVMDGFSSAWGFSLSDMAANFIGVGSFALQQKHWGEQRFRFKMSSWPKSYSQEMFSSETGIFETTLFARTQSLFGSHGLERFLKDYNAQTLWLSVNPKSFFPDSKFPSWLNIAVGYGADNMFGGFKNQWELNDENFIIDHSVYPRTRQYVLALDYDLSKIKTKSPFWKTILGALNAFKFPAPAIEYTSEGDFNFHLIFKN